jgi:hypothetical protein
MMDDADEGTGDNIGESDPSHSVSRVRAVKDEANERVSLFFPPLFVVSWNLPFGVSAIGSTDNCPIVAAKVVVTRDFS